MPTKEQLETALINADKAGDVEAAKRLATALKSGQYDSPEPQIAVERPQYTPFAKVKDEVDPAELSKDPDWLRASRMMFKLREGQDWQGDDENLSEYGKNMMGDFNFNMVDMARYANKINTTGTQEEKEAFLYLMDTYDNTKFSWEGAGRAVLGIGTDPTSYVGLGPVVGSLSKITGRETTKQAIRESLTKSLGRTGVVAGMEGGIYGATSSTIEQGVEVSAGRKEGISGTQLAVDTGFGVVGGAALGTSVDFAANKIKTALTTRAAAKELELLNQQIAPGATGGPQGGSIPPPIPTQGVTPQNAVQPPPAVPAPPSAVPSPSQASPQIPPGLQPSPTQTVSTNPVDIGLTPEEILAVTRRQQKGRLPEDVPPTGVTPTGKALDELPLADLPTGLRMTPRSMAELAERVEEPIETLRNAPTADLPRIMETLRSSNDLTQEQIGDLSKTIQDYADELQVQKKLLSKQIASLPATDPRVTQLQTRLDALDERLKPVQLADDAFGSMAGSLLRQRRGALNPEKLTAENIMKTQGVSRQEAEQIQMELVEQFKRDQELQAKAKEYDDQIEQALQNNDLDTAGRLSAMKVAELDALADVHLQSEIKFFHKVNELTISNIFTPKTIMVNLVPSLLKTIIHPSLKFLMNNPFEAATRAELAASFAAMKAVQGAAWKAAIAAFKYEHAVLSREPGRLLEGELAIKGKTGGAIRFIPRLLLFSDEYLSQVNYAAIVAGRAAAEATIDGASKGITGKALKDRAKRAAASAVEGAYVVKDTDDLIRPIINKGVQLGYSGQKLYKYVYDNAKNLSALRSGSDKDAIALVNDVLYKRRFSGQGTPSKGAQAIEGLLMQFPASKFVLGQLFFRTPIRVFEEAVRMTPGLQIIAPNWLSDLRGKNGQARQIRAQGEAMMSIAFAGAVLSLYSQGMITGDGAHSDWKASRTEGDSARAPMYSIKMDDGYFNYRTLDPVSTPLKIMINGFERFDKLAIREAQGELVDKAEYKQALAFVNVGVGAIAMALRDANLVEGIDQLVKLGENLGDPEAKEGAWVKFFGERLAWLVPNSFHKLAIQNDPTMKDPVTFEQVLMTRLGATVGMDNIKTARSYDVLGNVRRVTDMGALWNMFSVATPEELAKGRSQQELVVMDEISKLQRETGFTFTPPLKHKLTGPLDLRTLMTADGKETLYDKWQRKYQELNPAQALYPIATAPLPTGTFKHKSLKVTLLSQQMAELRDIAFMQVMAEEKQVLDAFVTETLNKAKAEAGLMDYNRQF